MHILTQVIGLVLTNYIYIIWRLHHKLDSLTDNIFVVSVILAILGQGLDIMVQLVMSNTLVVSEITKNVIVYGYLVSIPLYILSFGLYINSIIFDADTYLKLRAVIFVIAFVCAAITFSLPYSFNFNPACSIPEGPAVLFTYFFTGDLAAILFILLIVYRNKITSWKFYASLAWIGVFLIGGLAQFALLNTLFVPVISFAIAIGILVLYLIIENPGNRFDYISNCFHYDAFIEYINEVIRNKELFSILFINISYRNNEKYDFVKQFFLNVIRINDRNKNIRIFKGYQDEMIVTARDFTELQNYSTTILNCINQAEKEMGTYQQYLATVTFIPDITKIKNFDALRDIFNNHRIRNKTTDDPFEVYLVDDKEIETYNEDRYLINQLDNAILNDRVDMNFQTIIPENDNNAVHVEAAVGYILDNGRMIKPIEYIPYVEKYNMFAQIDRNSLLHAFKGVSELSKENKLGLMFVRCSVQMLENDNFYPEFTDLLKKFEISPKKICLEITNVDAIRKKDTLLKNIDVLKKDGVSLAIGGFGSRESNLNYFIDIPLDYVKYDPSVLFNAMNDEKAYMIMREITDLAHELGFLVIAVGIEDEAGMKMAKECSIDYYMGRIASQNYSESAFVKEMSLEEAK